MAEGARQGRDLRGWMETFFFVHGGEGWNDDGGRSCGCRAVMSFFFFVISLPASC
jgi:hypothetical protein